jgi:hypothetical protein
MIGWARRRIPGCAGMYVSDTVSARTGIEVASEHETFQALSWRKAFCIRQRPSPSLPRLLFQQLPERGQDIDFIEITSLECIRQDMNPLLRRRLFIDHNKILSLDPAKSSHVKRPFYFQRLISYCHAQPVGQLFKLIQGRVIVHAAIFLRSFDDLDESRIAHFFQEDLTAH